MATSIGCYLRCYRGWDHFHRRPLSRSLAAAGYGVPAGAEPHSRAYLSALVSLIFLPVTALTGFFGMNFNWLIASIASGEAFIILGVLLPLLSVMLTIAWLWHRNIVSGCDRKASRFASTATAQSSLRMIDGKKKPGSTEMLSA